MTVASPGVVLSETFETDPWSRWLRDDSTNGAYTWERTMCAAHSGTYSVDAVRGGSSGSAVGCNSTYPNSVSTAMAYGQCINIQGASQAWLDFYLAADTEQQYDYVGVWFADNNDNPYGWMYWGTWPAWFHAIFNLREWYSIGDLTQLACNRLLFGFTSDSSVATGFGARIDDITVRTDSAPGLSCSFSSSVTSGSAPLTVQFTPTVSGASGSESYSWDFGDGSTSTDRSPTHVYSTAGEYETALKVTDGSACCISSGHVSVSQGGGALNVTISQIDPSSCPTVKVMVSVTDSQGQPATGLGQGNFALKEDGTSQAIGVEQAGGGASLLAVSLVLDSSGSLTSSDIGNIKLAAISFINMLQPGDLVAVYNFWDYVQLVQDYTSDKSAAIAAVNTLSSGGSTTLYDAIYQAADHSQTVGGRKALVVMTDGEDTASSHTLTDAVTEAMAARVPVFTIGFGSANGSVLSSIANQTGGVFYQASGSSELQDLLSRIGQVLNNQYVLTWTTSHRDGGNHSVQVTAQLGSATDTKSATYSQAGSPCAAPPVADFSWSPPAPTVGQQVQFSDASTGSPSSWSWSFGDGGSSTLENPTHTFRSAGSYTVSLTASNSSGSNTRSRVLTVVSTCSLACQASVPASASVGQAVTFTGAATTTGCQGTPTYNWDFGDGSPHSAQQNPSHTYGTAGTFTWTLTASLGGATCTKSGAITVSAAPPTLQLNVTVTNVANVSPVANQFTIWLHVEDAGGALPAHGTRGNYGARIVPDNAGQPCDQGTCADGKTIEDPLGNGNWKVTFEIRQRNGSNNAPYFENGLLQLFRVSPAASQTIPGDHFTLSVYGTDFDTSKDSYPFVNWETRDSQPKDESEKAVRTLRERVPAGDRQRFAEDVGLGVAGEGTCYGMVASAIANFTHRHSAQSWGDNCAEHTAEVCDWIDEQHNGWQKAIDSRWPAGGSLSGQNRPYLGPTAAATASWIGVRHQSAIPNIEAARKIPYYHLAQGSYSPSETWIGKDGSTFWDWLPGLTSLLKDHRPVLVNLTRVRLPWSPNANHTVLAVQLLSWKLGSALADARLVVYDPNQPEAISEIMKVAEFRELTLDGNDLLLASILAGSWRLCSVDRQGKPDCDGPRVLWVTILGRSDDSQDIYGLRSSADAGLRGAESCQAWQGDGDGLSASLATGALNLPGYAQVTVGGGESIEVSDSRDGRNIAVVRNGPVDGQRPVVMSVPGGHLADLYLPIGQVLYRVAARKDAAVADFGLYASVPTSDGQIEKVGYESVQPTSDDSTVVSVLVGQGNGDHSLQRISGSGVRDTLAPTFVVKTPIGAPAVEDFQAQLVGNVGLTWEIPQTGTISKVRIMRKQGQLPLNENDGALVYEGLGTYATDNGVGAGLYYYGAYSFDQQGNVGEWTYTSLDTRLGCVRGFVKQSAGSGVAGATLLLSGPGNATLQTNTDQQGRYTFCNLATGSYTLTCGADGFDIVDPTRSVSVGGQGTEVDFAASSRTAITVTSPNGGEQWAVGSRYYVSWKAAGSVGSVNVDYSVNSGSTWQRIASSQPSTGAFLWQVPNTPSSNCLVRVTSGATSDASDATFSIGSCFAVGSASASPSSGAAPLDVSFQGWAASTPCMAAATYDWDFGDGTAHATVQNPTHRYLSAGAYTWTMTAQAAGVPVIRSGDVVAGSSSGQFRYLIPALAHAPGANGTQWRSDLTIVNESQASAAVTVTFLDVNGGQPVSTVLGIEAGATISWTDVMAALFGASDSVSRKGAIRIDSTAQLAAFSRTYNLTGFGSFGQSYPALTANDAITPGQLGVLPQLKKNALFRTNVGFAELSGQACLVRARLFGASGAQVGQDDLITVPGGGWWQQDDIFGAVGAGNQDIAYATVEPLTTGGKVWAYASVIDNATGDPTMIALVPLPGKSAVIVPAIAHAPGVGGTQWRTDVAVVNPTSSTATLTAAILDYDSGSATTRTLSLGGRATVEWQDVLVSIFGIAGTTSMKATLSITSTAPVIVSGRTYNRESAVRTYGQAYPALTSANGLQFGQVGVIPGLARNVWFRTNVGVVNFSPRSCNVSVTLFDGAGRQLGSSKVLTVEANRWRQQDDIFGATSAGDVDLAYATVEVQTPGCSAWAYASVMDNATGDPTTIEVIRK
jgi:VWFA-related protein